MSLTKTSNPALRLYWVEDGDEGAHEHAASPLDAIAEAYKHNDDDITPANIVPGAVLDWVYHLRGEDGNYYGNDEVLSVENDDEVYAEVVFRHDLIPGGKIRIEAMEYESTEMTCPQCRTES